MLKKKKKKKKVVWTTRLEVKGQPILKPTQTFDSSINIFS